MKFSNPIIIHRLTDEGLNVLKQVDEFIRFTKFRTMELTQKEFDLLLNAIPLHRRLDYQDAIPYRGIILKKVYEKPKINS